MFSSVEKSSSRTLKSTPSRILVFGASSAFFVAAELGEANKQEMCGIALIVSGVRIDISCLSLDSTCSPRKTEDVS